MAETTRNNRKHFKRHQHRTEKEEENTNSTCMLNLIYCTIRFSIHYVFYFVQGTS